MVVWIPCKPQYCWLNWKRFDWEVEQRAKIGARYTQLIKEQLSDKNPQLHIVTPEIDAHNTSVYAQYTVRVKNREQVQQKLKDAGVPTAVHYPIPLHLQPAFTTEKQGIGSFPAAESVANEVMSLPMYPDLDEKTQLRILDALVKASK